MPTVRLADAAPAAPAAAPPADTVPAGGPPASTGRPVRPGRRAIAFAGAAVVAAGPVVAEPGPARPESVRPRAGVGAAGGRWLLRGGDR